MKYCLNLVKYSFLVSILNTALLVHGADSYGAWFLPVDCTPRTLRTGNNVLFSNSEPSKGITAVSITAGNNDAVGTKFILQNIGTYMVTVGIIATDGNGFTIMLDDVATPPNFIIATGNTNRELNNPITLTLTTTKTNSVLRVALSQGSNAPMCQNSVRRGPQAFISILQVQ